MGRREEEPAASRRHGRHKASPSPARGEEDEEAIRNKLRESGWKKRRADGETTPDAEAPKDRERPETSPPRAADDRRSVRPSRGSRRSRSPRRRDREHRSSRRKSSGSRRRSVSSSSRSRSRSAGRRRRRHSSSKKRRSSRSPSRSRDVRDSKRSRRASRSTSASKLKPPQEVKEEKKEEKKKEKKEDEDETETENEDAEKDEKEKKDERHKKSSRRSHSGSPRSPSRSSRRRRHRRNLSYSRSRSPSRSRRSRRGGSRSRSRSFTRDRRPRGRERDRRSRRRYSRSRSPSFSRRRRRSDRSSSRDRKRREPNSSPEPHQHPPVAPDAAAATSSAVPSTGAPTAAPGNGVNPTITQLMAQYPTMSLQDIIAKMQASNVTMAAAVAQKPARELYVGNLPPNVTGPQLQEFLSTIIQQVGLTTQPGNPIVNTWISTDGHFAFCEMRSVEECNLALLLNQLSLLGQPLKFGRPRSFMGPPQPMPQISARAQTALANLGCTPNPAWFAQPTDPTAALAEPSTLAEATMSTISAAQPAVVTDAAASSPHRLIMSNIPIVLAEDQVKELVEPFGALKSFTLVKDPATGASMGSALFEYEDDAVAAQAVEGLNGLSIGGILLSVQRQPLGGVAAAGALPAAVPNPEDQPSPVLKMANMVSVDELRDDEEYADLAEDVEEECKRFGEVTGMEIPRPKDGEEVPGLGCIYVRFEKEDDSVSALKSLNGRKFGGNIVKVTYFPLDKFEKHELF